jgi:hypothetical protein
VKARAAALNLELDSVSCRLGSKGLIDLKKFICSFVNVHLNIIIN